MGKMIDMTGWVMKEHGVNDSKVTVMYKSDKKDNHGCYWHCKCECGNEFEVRGDSLRNGKTKSCGCIKNELLIKNGEKTRYLLEDLTGQDFGLWHVENRAENNGNHTMWNCNCKCGTKRIVRGELLRNGSSQSCGCISFSRGENEIKKILEKNNIFFEQEKKFENCKDIQILRFDFYVDNKYIIEYDGIQHFKYNGTGWNTKEHLIKTKEHDEIKNQYCRDNKIPLIRIPYTQLENLCLEDLLLETSNFLVE